MTPTRNTPDNLRSKSSYALTQIASRLFIIQASLKCSRDPGALHHVESASPTHFLDQPPSSIARVLPLQEHKQSRRMCSLSLVSQRNSLPLHRFGAVR